MPKPVRVSPENSFSASPRMSLRNFVRTSRHAVAAARSFVGGHRGHVLAKVFLVRPDHPSPFVLGIRTVDLAQSFVHWATDSIALDSIRSQSLVKACLRHHLPGQVDPLLTEDGVVGHRECLGRIDLARARAASARVTSRSCRYISIPAR